MMSPKNLLIPSGTLFKDTEIGRMLGEEFKSIFITWRITRKDKIQKNYSVKAVKIKDSDKQANISTVDQTISYMAEKVSKRKTQLKCSDLKFQCIKYNMENKEIINSFNETEERISWIRFEVEETQH